MDLYAELKESLQKPFSIKSFVVIFSSLFLVLACGLIVTFFFRIFFPISFTACNSPFNTTFNGSVSKTNEKVFTFNFVGNSNCFLDSWVTWNNSSQAINLWVYDPSGNVNYSPSSLLQTHNNFSQGNLKTGTWRFVLRTDSEKPLSFSGEIGVH